MARNGSPGRLLVISAPSGAGKTTLVHALLGRQPGVRFSTSYTTRQKRVSETEGKDYFFVSEEEFLRMMAADEFLEHAQVFDHWYGTGRRHVQKLLDSGYSVLLDIDWQGARQVRERAPESASIFILPPSIVELERRLRSRGTDSDVTIRRRLRDALSDMSHWTEFDFAVVNDDLERAATALAEIVSGNGERHRTDSPQARERVAELLAGAGAAGAC